MYSVMACSHMTESSSSLAETLSMQAYIMAVVTSVFDVTPNHAAICVQVNAMTCS
jgi:hypothetical protein